MAINEISIYIPDYLAASLPEKLALLHTLKLNHLEISHREVALESLPASEIYNIRNLFIDEGCFISLYETSFSPADKTSLNALLRNAHFLGIPFIKLDFSVCADQDVAYCLDAFESYGITPLIENNASSAFRDSAQLQSFLKRPENRVCKVIFNPLEYVKTQRHPFFHVYYAGRLKNHIMILRINDGLYLDGSTVPSGQGNGEVKELISIMKARSFNGYFSISPYMPSSTVKSLADTVVWLRRILKSL